MMKIPAQHNTTNPPGQIVNPVPKQESEKLSFDTWWKIVFVPENTYILDGLTWKPGASEYKAAWWAWRAAQENK